LLITRSARNGLGKAPKRRREQESTGLLFEGGKESSRRKVKRRKDSNPRVREGKPAALARTKKKRKGKKGSDSPRKGRKSPSGCFEGGEKMHAAKGTQRKKQDGRKTSPRRGKEEFSNSQEGGKSDKKVERPFFRYCGKLINLQRGQKTIVEGRKNPHFEKRRIWCAHSEEGLSGEGKKLLSNPAKKLPGEKKRRLLAYGKRNTAWYGKEEMIKISRKKTCKGCTRQTRCPGEEQEGFSSQYQKKGRSQKRSAKKEANLSRGTKGGRCA